MNTLGTLSMAVLLLLVAGSARTYSQDADRPGQAQEEKAKPNDTKHETKAGPQEERKDKDKDQPGMKQEERKDKDKEQPGMKQDERGDRTQQKEERNETKMDRNQNQH